MPDQNQYDEIKELREALSELRQVVATLVTEVAVLTASLSRVVGNDDSNSDKIRNLELDVNNNKLVVSAVKWLAVSFVGSAIMVGVTAFYAFMQG